ncbi:MAG: LOG family protein [Acidimicrobiales bacterium]
MRAVCVFSGSNPGLRAEYLAAAQALGTEIATRGMRLVYGGASVGLMAAVADAALAAGGDVVGVIPRHLVDAEISHRGLTELRVTSTMHERKAKMAELSDGFVALPGGLGTLEEIVEALTWSQLGLHAKPCSFLDTAGYYQPLLAFLDHAVAECFVLPAHRDLVLSGTDPGALLASMATWVPPPASDKWTDRPRRPRGLDRS